MWEDRKKQELKEAAIAAKTPSKDCDRGLFSNSHPMLSSWIQSRKLTITIKSILLFQSIKIFLPSSLRGSCNIVVPTVDSLRGTGSDRRFLQLLFFPVFPHTFPSFFSRYNRENLQSGTSYFHISKKYFPLPPCIIHIIISIH